MPFVYLAGAGMFCAAFNLPSPWFLAFSVCWVVDNVILHWVSGDDETGAPA